MGENMAIVMVGAEKGGVGKSTLNQNMAAIRASLGFRVAIYDADRQGSSKKFITRRREQEGVKEIGLRHIAELEPNEHARVEAEVFTRDVMNFAKDYDVVFLDIGGKDTDLFRAALLFADRIIVPLTPSMQDLDTVPDLLSVTDRIEERIGRSLTLNAVLNQADPRKRMTRYITKQMEGFADTLPLLPNTIGFRESFKFGYALGRGVHELKGVEFDPIASSEMKGLYMEVFK
jgi:chromosome partitioning protein